MAERAANRVEIPGSLKVSMCSLTPKYIENVRINTKLILLLTPSHKLSFALSISRLVTDPSLRKLKETLALKYLIWELNSFQQLWSPKKKCFLCQRQISNFN